MVWLFVPEGFNRKVFKNDWVRRSYSNDTTFNGWKLRSNCQFFFPHGTPTFPLICTNMKHFWLAHCRCSGKKLEHHLLLLFTHIYKTPQNSSSPDDASRLTELRQNLWCQNLLKSVECFGLNKSIIRHKSIPEFKTISGMLKIKSLFLSISPTNWKWKRKDRMKNAELWTICWLCIVTI